MTTIKINEQIAFLRKQNGFTQEEVANALGVTNQAVSKWESAQCCPDIQLLPDIAELFHVSVDTLLGRFPVSTSEDFLLNLRRQIDSLPQGEDFDFTFRMAAALHVIILSKAMEAEPNENPGWRTDDAIEYAGSAKWGYSCCNIPEITTTMRHGAVFFSNNKNFNLTNKNIYRITSIMKPFCNAENFKIAVALYQLTNHAEDAFATVRQVSEKSGFAEEKIAACLTGELLPFLLEKSGEASVGESEYRFDGMYMNLLPIMSLFDFK